MAYGSTSTTQTVDADPTVVAQLLGSVSNPGDIAVVNGTGLNYVSTTPGLIIDNNTVGSVHTSVETTVAAGTGSTLNFTGSRLADGTPAPISVYTSGSDKVVLNRGADLAQSFGTNDTLRSGGGQDTLIGGIAATKLVGGGQSQIQGSTNGGDTIVAGLSSSSQDTISSSGSSLIAAKQGQNVIYGGAGDTIQAGSSQDSIFSDTGSTISGGQGASIFSGGDSLLKGGQGNTYSLQGGDTLKGGQGDNTVSITRGASVEVDGGAGHLDVSVQAGKLGVDTLFGGSGGLTVHVGAAMGSLVSDDIDKTDNTIHHLTFSNGQQLVTGGVTLEFTNGKSYNA